MTTGAEILRQAVMAGDLSKTRALLDGGADPNTVVQHHPVLAWACKTAHHEIAGLLIERGATVHAYDESGDQPIHFAARNKNSAALGLLLRSGADITARNNFGTGSAPLEMAVDCKSIEAVQLLLDAGAVIPADLDVEPYWQYLLETRVDDAEVDTILAIKRLVRAASLGHAIGSAMSEGAPDPAPRRAAGPGPL